MLALFGWSSVLVMILVIIFAGPLVTLWSLNTLFGLGIPYDIWTYLATLWLAGLGTLRWNSKG